MNVRKLTTLAFRLVFPLRHPCSTSKSQPQPQGESGTDYSNWVLARAAGHNHSIAHLRRRQPKDRYSLHRLTNLDYICKIIVGKVKYELNHNEKIVLLAQFNHVLEVVGRQRGNYYYYMDLLFGEIIKEMENPPDLVCLGTLMSSMTTMHAYEYQVWLKLVDDILVQKFDEDYDELFGLVIGLNKYKKYIRSLDDYQLISKNEILPKISSIYRNSLDVMRQFVTQNIYNLKECRILFEVLYEENINEGYFWDAVRDWFNIYTKEQLVKKEIDEFFIMKESAVEKILHDHGVIRPRPILQELSSIMYILSEFGNTSWRFVEFAQDLILYAIQNGSKIYARYQAIAHKQEEKFSKIEKTKEGLNQHMGDITEEAKVRIKEMEKQYRTIFVNPISIRDNFVVYLLVVLSRAYGQYIQSQKSRKSSEKQPNFYDKKEQVYLDPRVKKWLMMQLVKPDMQYTVRELLMVNRCSDFVKDTLVTMGDFVTEKLKNLRSKQTNFKELAQIMQIIPLVRLNQLNYLFGDFLGRSHPSEIHSLIKLIEQKSLFIYLAQLLMRLPKAINAHYKYYSFQENCYFFLMILKNMNTIDTVTNNDRLRLEFDKEMEQLKEMLKIMTYSRGFKLSVNSYFHQVMDYIDVVDFFEGGRG